MTDNKPSLILYAVREYRAGAEIKKHWVRIGAAWPHGDNKGFNIKQEFLPLDGEYKLVLREPLPDDEAADPDTSF